MALAEDDQTKRRNEMRNGYETAIQLSTDTPRPKAWRRTFATALRDGHSVATAEAIADEAQYRKVEDASHGI